MYLKKIIIIYKSIYSNIFNNYDKENVTKNSKKCNVI